MSGIKKIASLMTIISLTIFTISCNSTTNNQESVVQNNTNVLISSIDNNLAEEAIENVGNGTNNAETNENVNVTLEYENPSFIKENENTEDNEPVNELFTMAIDEENNTYNTITYEVPGHPLILKIPERWSEIEVGKSLLASFSLGDGVTVNLMSLDIRNKNRLKYDEIIDLILESFKNEFEEFEHISTDTILVNGKDATSVIYKVADDTLSMQVHQVYLEHNGIFYIFTYEASLEKFETYHSEFKAVVETVKFKSK